MKTAIAFLRVSKSSQVTKRQKQEIQSYANSNSIKIVKWLEKKTSGSQVKKYRGEIFNAAIEKKVDFVMFQEVTRIGRDMKENQILKADLHDNNIGLIITSQNIVTMKDGEIDPTQEMVINHLITQAVFERDLLSVRIRSGLKASTEKPGRPKGVKGQVDYLKRLNDNASIVSMLTDQNNNYSISKIASNCKTSRSHVYRIKDLAIKHGVLK